MKIKFSWLDSEAADLIEIVGGKNDKWLLHSICEWQQVFGRWNWVDFHVAHLYLMRDVALPGFEISAILLGLGFRFRINGDWSTTECGRDMLKYDFDSSHDNLEHTKGECPFCDGTGLVNVIKPKDE
jgi:hypothetical protein